MDQTELLQKVLQEVRELRKVLDLKVESDDETFREIKIQLENIDVSGDGFTTYRIDQ